MHPDHARSFVLANSRGEGAGGEEKERRASLFARQSTRVHVCECTPTSWGEWGREGGRDEYTKLDSLWPGANSIFRCIEYFKDTICRLSRRLFQDTTGSIHQLPIPPPSHLTSPPFGMQYFAVVCIVFIIQVRRLVDRYQQVFASFCMPWLVSRCWNEV